jgi:oligopeptide/dipeptide ABC transporter ATP-binding protein
MSLLTIQDLTISFAGTRGPLQAVSGVSFRIERGERIALVGESGSGKTLTGMSCLGLVPPNAAMDGSVRVAGVELIGAGEPVLRTVRGSKVGVVFQDPATSLNPVRTVGDQVAEMFRQHRGTPRAEARERAVELMQAVRIPAAGRRYDDYPHQMSGGMKQRVMIAIALTLNPDLLVLDEPTTALDVTVESQIIDLLLELSDSREMALLMISHDLGVVSNVCERVLTMYAGQIVEEGPTRRVYEEPAHPYTRALLDSIVDVGEPACRMEPIPGHPPTLGDMPRGCRFAPRCPLAVEKCREPIPLFDLGDGRSARCIFAGELVSRGEFAS